MGGIIAKTSTQSVASARGTVVVDRNLRGLKGLLQDLNIRVLLLPSGALTYTRKQELLANRILVTLRPKIFESDASSLDLGIFVVETNQAKDLEKLARLISDALTKFSLWSRRHGYSLTLTPSGRHRLQALTD